MGVPILHTVGLNKIIIHRKDAAAWDIPSGEGIDHLGAMRLNKDNGSMYKVAFELGTHAWVCQYYSPQASIKS